MAQWQVMAPCLPWKWGKEGSVWYELASAEPSPPPTSPTQKVMLYSGVNMGIPTGLFSQFLSINFHYH